MACSLMYIKDTPKSERGFTLAEMSVAMAVSGIILTALLSFTMYASRSFAAMNNYVDLEQKSQNALDIMTRDIRETQYLTNYGTMTLNGQTITNSLTFLTDSNEFLSFQFTNNLLIKTRGAESWMLLTNVDYLNFQVF